MDNNRIVCLVYILPSGVRNTKKNRFTTTTINTGATNTQLTEVQCKNIKIIIISECLKIKIIGLLPSNKFRDVLETKNIDENNADAVDSLILSACNIF